MQVIENKAEKRAVMRLLCQAIGFALIVLTSYHGLGELHQMVQLETIKEVAEGLPELEKMSQGLTGQEPDY